MRQAKPMRKLMLGRVELEEAGRHFLSAWPIASWLVVQCRLRRCVGQRRLAELVPALLQNFYE